MPADPASDANASSLGKSTSHRRPGPIVITVIVIALLILHQDNWFWTDDTLVFGFMPIGLAWHAGISISASITWFIATRIAWPIDDATVAAVIAQSDTSVQDEGAN
ncbi:MAG: DUF3311 domain-containing protein [Planctomycetota bacterium]